MSNTFRVQRVDAAGNVQASTDLSSREFEKIMAYAEVLDGNPDAPVPEHNLRVMVPKGRQIFHVQVDGDPSPEQLRVIAEAFSSYDGPLVSDHSLNVVGLNGDAVDPIFSFGTALFWLDRGRSVARKSVPELTIYKVDGSTFTVNRPPLSEIMAPDTVINYQPHLDFNTFGACCGTWTPNSLDIFATDWYLVPTPFAPSPDNSPGETSVTDELPEKESSAPEIEDEETPHEA